MVFFSCSKEKSNGLLLNDEIVSEESITNSPNFVLQNIRSQEIIKEIENKQNILKTKIKKAKGKDVDKLYLEYSKSLNQLIKDLDENENNSLLIYNTWDNSITPDSIQNKLELYEKLQIRIIENTDGTYHLKFRPGFYYDLFKSKASRDLRNYLKIATEHRKNPVIANGKINVSWFEISNRLVAWENYIKQNPNSAYKENAKAKYLELINLYFFGNKYERAYSIENKKINTEIEQEYINAVKKHSKTSTASLTKTFLDYFYTNDKNFEPDEFNKKLTEYTNLEIEKEMKKF